eukprot:COSAG01_NODE_31546_length_595_cov_5.483871_1_plen_144_part_01
MGASCCSRSHTCACLPPPPPPPPLLQGGELPYASGGEPGVPNENGGAGNNFPLRGGKFTVPMLCLAVDMLALHSFRRALRPLLCMLGANLHTGSSIDVPFADSVSVRGYARCLPACLQLWEGGIRGHAFVSGGALPVARRGKRY